VPFSPDEIERYARQVQLPEWGAAGQERIRAAGVVVHGMGPAAETAIRYLAAAGVGAMLIDETLLAGPGQIASAVNANIRIESGTPPWRISAPDFTPPPRPHYAIRIDNGWADDLWVVEATEDRDAVGAACAVEALKAILGLPHRNEVTLPRIDEVAE
jgi:hypothetical protein